MSERIEFIVQQLNRGPFKKRFSLVDFDSLKPTQLLQILNEVLAEIDPKHAMDIAETPDQMAKRMTKLLKLLKYSAFGSGSDMSNFQQGLERGSKSVIHPILHWLLQRVPCLKKRAYLAPFLVKLDVPNEFLTDHFVSEMYHQHEELIEEFKTCYKECEQLKESAVCTESRRRDIAVMEKEKDQLIARVDHVRKQVECVSNHQRMLEEVRRLRVELQREETLAQQQHEQNNQLLQAEQILERCHLHLKDLQAAAADTNPKTLIKRLEEMIKIRSYMVSDQLPKELNFMRRKLHYLQKLASEPTLDPHELEEMKYKIKQLNLMNHEMKQKMVKSDTMDNDIAVCRQKASIIARKKEAKAEELHEAREELAVFKRELNAKSSQDQGQGGVMETISRDEFKQYTAQVREKIITYKEMRKEMAMLKADLSNLKKTEEILQQCLAKSQQQVQSVEEKNGISGYTEIQEKLEKAVATQSELEGALGHKLEDKSEMVKKLNSEIAKKKSALYPLIKELRPLRQQCQEFSNEYAEKKNLYDICAAHLENKTSKLEQEVKALQEEITQEEDTYHKTNCMNEMLEVQMNQVNDEIRICESSDPEIQKTSIRDQYMKKIAEQESLGEELREQQKHVSEEHQNNVRQVHIWNDLEQLLECKIQCFLRGQSQASVGQVIQDNRKDRLVL